MGIPLDLKIKKALIELQSKMSQKEEEHTYQKALTRIDKHQNAEDKKEYDRLLKTDMKEQIEREKEKNRQKKANAQSNEK